MKRQAIHRKNIIIFKIVKDLVPENMKKTYKSIRKSLETHRTNTSNKYYLISKHEMQITNLTVS